MYTEQYQLYSEQNYLKEDDFSTVMKMSLYKLVISTYQSSMWFYFFVCQLKWKMILKHIGYRLYGNQT